MCPECKDAVVELFDGVVDLDDLILPHQVILPRETLVDFNQLPRVISVQEQKYVIPKILFSAGWFADSEGVEVFEEILAGLHLVTSNDVAILRVVLALRKLIGVLDVSDGPVQVDLIEHDLLLTVILLFPLFLYNLPLLRRNTFFNIRLVLSLFFVDDNGIGVILDSLIISA